MKLYETVLTIPEIFTESTSCVLGPKLREQKISFISFLFLNMAKYGKPSAAPSESRESVAW